MFNPCDLKLPFASAIHRGKYLEVKAEQETLRGTASAPLALLERAEKATTPTTSKLKTTARLQILLMLVTVLPPPDTVRLPNRLSNFLSNALVKNFSTGT